MEISVHLHIDATTATNAVSVNGNTVQFKAPDALSGCGFPGRELQLQVPSVTCGGPLAGNTLPIPEAIATGLSQRRNSVVFAYGTRLTSKRSCLVGTTAEWQSGILAQVLARVPLGGHVVGYSYVLGDSDELRDMVNPANEEARISESVREGPRLSGLTRVPLRSQAEAAAFAQAVATNAEAAFAGSTKLPTAPQEQLVPPYVAESLVVGVLVFASEAPAAELGPEVNSVHLVALGDSQRPILCGVDAAQLQSFEKTQRTLAGAMGILIAIKSSRLRVPFGKSRLTSLLKRAYNAEKGNPHSAGNAPTTSYLIAHALGDEVHAEESYQTLATVRRVLNPGLAVSGMLTRDMAVDKWRLEQDIVELRDELAVAKAVFGYKPCIVEQPKPVPNIQEEEQKRVTEILRRREEVRNKQRAELDERTRVEAAALIEQEERASGMTLRQLEDSVAQLRRDNEQLETERARKKQEHERYLEKVRKKREEEEQQEEALRGEIATIEEDAARKQDELARKQRQLELASQDMAKGREVVLKEREELRVKRARQLEERRTQRRKWLEEIRQTNERMLAQVATLKTLREQREASGAPASTEDAETEEMAREDIESINKYLPRLIALEDTPADIEQTESIRRQLEAYLAQEREAYAARLEEEKARLAALEQQVNEYKGKVKEFQQSRRRDMVVEAVKKEHHVQSLIDQIIQYLQHGVRMQKVSSNGQVRRRLFFISDDCRKIYACDLDDAGNPLNRRKPTTTILVQDIKRVSVGMYSTSFSSYARSAPLRQQRDEAMRDHGTLMVGATPPLFAGSLGKYNYRAFALELRSGKTVELVCDQDSDCEAWLLALKRLLCYRTPAERKSDLRTGRASADTIGEIQWGEKLTLTGRAGLDELYADEAAFCAENHIPPRLFVKTRAELVTMSQNLIVTVYDVRKASTLDLLRSQALLEYLTEKGVLPPLPA